MFPETLGSMIKRAFPKGSRPEVHQMVDIGSSELLDVLDEAIESIMQEVSELDELDQHDRTRAEDLHRIRKWLRDCCK